MKKAKRQLRRSWAPGLAAACFTVWLFACQAEEPIRIGFIAGTSGRVADSGISGRDAAQLAVEQCNQAGGIHGRKVQLIAKDDQQNPDRARQCMDELVGLGVAAVVGPMTSDMAVAITPLADEARIILMSPTATTDLLSDQDDYFLRVASTSATFADYCARFLLQKGNIHRVIAAYDLGNASFSEMWVANFRKFFTSQGGELIDAVGFKAEGEQTFMDIARRLVADQPDGVVIVANSMDSALLCQQIRKIDSQVAIILSDWGGTERLLELGGKAVEGITVVQAFDRGSQAPAYQAFREIYIKRFQREPGFPGVNTYDAIQVVLAALKDQKSSRDLKQTILDMNCFDGLQTKFCFNASGDAVRPQVSISRVENNRFVVVE